MTEVTDDLRLRVGAALAVAFVGAAVAVYACSLVDVDPPMWTIAAIFWGFPIVLAARELIEQRRMIRPRSDLDKGPRRRSLTRTAVFLVPFVVLVPGLFALLTSPRIQLSFHGYLHSAYIYEILNGSLPPDNPLLAGEPANDYWLFHVLVAAVVYVIHLAPPFVAATINLVALVVCLSLVSWILKSLDLLPRSRLFRGATVLVVLFGLNVLGMLHVLVNGVAGSSNGGDVMNLDAMLLHGAARSAGLFAKFLNFNGFPLGVAFFLLALGCAIRLTREVSVRAASGFAAAGLAALAFHATTGVFTLTVLPTSVVVAWLVSRTRPTWRLSRREGLLIAAGAVVAAVLLSVYVGQAARGLEEGATFGGFGDNIQRFLGVTYPLLPLFGVGAVDAVRRKRPELLMLVTLGSVGFVASTITVLPGGNQYKFDYLTTFAVTLVAVASWRSLRANARPLAIVGAAIAFAGVLSAQLYIGINYLRSDWMTDDTVAYEGTDVVGRAPAKRARAWEWLEDNSSVDAIVVVPVMNKDRARFLPIAERRAYVLEGGPFTAGKPEFARRVDAVRTVYSSGSSERSLSAAADIAEDVDTADVFIAAMTHGQIQNMRELGWRPVFDGEAVDLFELTGD